MSSLSSLGLGADVQEETVDTLGGFNPLDSNVYRASLGLCYLGKSPSGARSVTVVYKAGGKENRETFYITNKKGEPTYVRDGVKHPLPGYSRVNAILFLATGKGISEQATETRVIKLYNAEAKKEIPTEVECLVAALDAELALGILKVVDNKTKKVGTEYVPTAETRTFNEIDTAFSLQGLTYTETKNGVTEPTFLPKWKEKYVGNEVVRAKNVAPAAASAPASTSSIDFG